MTTSDPTPPPDDAHTPRSAASKLFDIRFMIGGLFLVYGVLLTIYALFDSPEEKAKAAGIHINLWLGLSMLAVGVIFGIWARVQPVKPADPSEVDTDRPVHH